MKEIELKKELTVKELAETFRKQTERLMPGKWKLVGIQFHLVDEEKDVLASPGIYSKGFAKEDYEVA